MLEIENKEYFNEVVEFAHKVGKNEQFKEKLEYLGNYADHHNEGLTKCYLYPDFAPYSFVFTMMKRGEDGEYSKWFNGGLIFHGNHDNNGDGSAPTFSVNLSSTDGWAIHT